jgi:hypothetical protein
VKRGEERKRRDNVSSAIMREYKIRRLEEIFEEVTLTNTFNNLTVWECMSAVVDFSN